MKKMLLLSAAAAALTMGAAQAADLKFTPGEGDLAYFAEATGAECAMSAPTASSSRS
jgi:opacity protein-like surface antigen